MDENLSGLIAEYVVSMRLLSSLFPGDTDQTSRQLAVYSTVHLASVGTAPNILLNMSFPVSLGRLFATI